ncbi:hypothetical protein P7K49_014870, partial [Saguinus oedipus]
VASGQCEKSEVHLDTTWHNQCPARDPDPGPCEHSPALLSDPGPNILVRLHPRTNLHSGSGLLGSAQEDKGKEHVREREPHLKRQRSVRALRSHNTQEDGSPSEGRGGPTMRGFVTNVICESFMLKELKSNTPSVKLQL